MIPGLETVGQAKGQKADLEGSRAEDAKILLGSDKEGQD